MMTLDEQEKRREMFRKNVTIWEPCNIYESARIGNDVSIGAFTEIGPDVVIGNGVRIGKGCFIPKGVIIEDDCFIGPHTCFTNDRFPQSPESDWESTFIRKGARIGASVTIVCGVIIGTGALIGAGSVVTKNVDPFTTVYGVPATNGKNGDK